MKMQIRSRTVALVVLTVMATLLVIGAEVGCAMHKSSSPDSDVTSETRWRLNISSQLADAERDYRTFFTDLGVAQRNAQVTPEQVKGLNELGNKAKADLEAANNAWIAYSSAPDDNKKAQVIALLTSAENSILALFTAKQEMQVGGGAR